MRKIEWTFPLPRPHAGIAMGNGLLGALIWGKDRINITLNRADFWDHRGEYVPTEGVSTYEHMKAAYRPDDASWTEEVFLEQPRDPSMNRPSRLPFGRFELELQPGIVPAEGELELATGRVTIRLAIPGRKTRKSVAFDLSVNSSVLWIQDPDELVRCVNVRTTWDWVGAKLTALAFPKPVFVSKPGVWGWGQGCPADPAMAAVCRQHSAGYVIGVERGTDAKEAIAVASRLASQTATSGLDALRKESAAWWKAYWKRAPTVRVPDAFMTRFYNFTLYKFGAATNPFSPWPASLQGPWVEEYQWPPWNADYHFNVNVQQVYTLAFASNQLEHLLPLFDRLESWRDRLRQFAKTVCGIDDGLIIGMCVDDRGALLGSGPGVLIDHASTGWVAQLFWHYYLYSGDVEFLRNRAYPFMQGVMRVYEAMLEEKDGRLSLEISISAEFGNDISPRWMGRDPSWQLACIHMLGNALLEAARILDVPPRPVWKTILEKVPPYTLVGKPGEERIAIWEGQDLDFCHRHHSHLACIYPFDSLGELTPEKERVLEDSIDHWISKGMGNWSEWCMPWAAIIQARMGFTEAPWLLLKIWKDLFINEGLAAVYLPRFRGITIHRKEDQKKPRETNEIMQLDGGMGGVTALYEMLVHNRRGETHVFPAVPEEWTDVSFRNIRLPGAFLISAERRNAALQSIRIQSLVGGTLTLCVADCSSLVLRRGGKSESVCLPVRLDLRRGETVTLTPLRWGLNHETHETSCRWAATAVRPH